MSELRAELRIEIFYTACRFMPSKHIAFVSLFIITTFSINWTSNQNRGERPNAFRN